MKNFYEAKDIKSALKLDLNLTLSPVGEQIPCRVTINDQLLFDNLVDKPFTLTQQLSLEDSININIDIKREHPQAIEVELDIDGYNILPLHQLSTTVKTCYIDFNHTWNLTIDNFYPWLHQAQGQGWIA